MADLTPRRRTRSDWLVEALEVLALEGEAELRIDHLAAHLGVTKGSFYWHFETRADFVRQLAEFWESKTTSEIADALEALDGPPEDRLMFLMQEIVNHGLGRYDIVMRAWATHNEVVAQIVRRVDRRRLDGLARLFSELGFSGTDLDLRTKLVATYMPFETAVGKPKSQKRRLAELPALRDLLIRV